MKHNLRFLLLIVFSALLYGCSTTAPANESATNKPAETKPGETKPAATKSGEPILISSGGDIMLGSPFPNASRMPPNDGRDLLQLVKPIFEAADLAFANLEGPLHDSGNSAKCGPNSSSCYAFRMPTRYAAYLRDAGIDVVSLANNHANDFGEAGRDSTRRSLDGVGVKHAGSDKENYAMTVLDVKGRRVAVVAFAHNSLTPNVNDLDFARQLVTKAAAQADLVMVSFHGGAEGAANARVPQRSEVFLGEQRGNLPAFARTVIDAGADLVIGHGPHVLRGMEIYKDRLIAYSLGNFVTYGWFPLAGATAESLVLDARLDADGKFIDGRIHPFIQRDRGILTADPTKSSVRTIKRLSQMDFPNSAPNIADDGTIKPR
ncbi:MAG: CapA family protein [Anaerolineae bacterium]|nr:CapA family protein [Anaerolineae bacterium]